MIENYEQFENSEEVDAYEKYEFPTKFKLDASDDSKVESTDSDGYSTSFSEKLDDVSLFERTDYNYTETDYGKHADGVLELNESVKRNSKNQREVGDADRRIDDDGGHLIGNRFGGSSEKENLFPQNRNMNRGGYKRVENSWAQELEKGDKCFVSVDTFSRNESERPDTVMAFSITEDSRGNRHWDTYSSPNESRGFLEQLDVETSTFEDEIGEKYWHDYEDEKKE